MTRALYRVVPYRMVSLSLKYEDLGMVFGRGILFIVTIGVSSIIGLKLKGKSPVP